MRVVVVILSAAMALAAQQPPVLAPLRSTEAVPNDADDPAIWVHPSDPARSLILGTDKLAERGGLYVFGLDGRRRQDIGPLDRPNNVDVEYGIATPRGPRDIAVVTERMQHRLRVFGIPADGGALVDMAPGGVPVLTGASGAAAEPMGIALYRRPRDGAVFAIVAPKAGSASEYLWQYRLRVDTAGVTATLVRRFGAFSGLGPAPTEPGEIEAVVVDDELGYVYYADEGFGIRKWHADPDQADAGRELAVFGRQGYEGDREGLAVYRPRRGRGYIVSSDQLPGRTRLMVYAREGTPDRPHEHPLLAVLPTPADATDGLDVTALGLPDLPAGLLVMMNSGPRTFLLFDWRAVAERLQQKPSR